MVFDMEIIKNKKCIKVKMCTKFLNRLKGFMFTKNINICLCFPKCNSIHTAFMLKPIDIIMTNKNYEILYIFKNVKPNNIILPKKDVYYTFELPINKFDFKINEKIKVE
jgi:uncharacterized membrane protein (UPF0127 family)